MRRLITWLVPVVALFCFSTFAFAFSLAGPVPSESCGRGHIEYVLSEEGTQVVKEHPVAAVSVTGDSTQVSWQAAQGYQLVQACITLGSGKSFLFPHDTRQYESPVADEITTLSLWVIEAERYPTPTPPPSTPSWGCSYLRVNAMNFAQNESYSGVTVTVELEGNGELLQGVTNNFGFVDFPTNIFSETLPAGIWNVQVGFDAEELYAVTPFYQQVKLPASECIVSFLLNPVPPSPIRFPYIVHE